jgi:LacI family repressor for deo operon, udp, cdd, tsx, nupC, and nupG
LKAQGIRTPEDISVTGFDDIAYAKYCDPSLIAFRNSRRNGQDGDGYVLRIIEGEPLSQTECILPTEFIIRKSTAPVKAS